VKLNHLHILVTARGLTAPPRTAEAVEAWLTELVSKVNMEILIPAQGIRCDDEGNEGATGVVCIKTSHASLHCWDAVEDPFLTMDLYSCKEFDVAVVLDHLTAFGPREVEYMIIDRNGSYRAVAQNTVRFR